MAADELPDDFFADIQGFFRKTPVLLIGSGFSCGYDLPGMGALAEHLTTAVHDVLTTNETRNAWTQSIEAVKENLEAGLNNIPLGAAEWGEIASAIRGETAKLILDKTIAAETRILGEKLTVCHAPSRLLNHLFKGSPQNAECIHVITTNYDTLLELFCDLANLPLDTGFMGFRRRRPRPHPLFQTQYNRVLVAEKRQQQVDHRLCKTVRLYKPHGSISWLTTDEGPVEVLNDVSVADRAIVVPGPSKYQDALVNTLFDAMRTEMNAVLAQTQALFCIGFGFNDDHLQGVIKRRLSEGMPLIIVTRNPTPNIEQLLRDHSHVIALFKSDEGASCHWNGNVLQSPEPLWQLDDFLRKFLE
ncbi:MAG: SIR2 family protein [Bacteroidales bacterium]|nr:SIR2 family protein [Bacteroidales bacterium]